MGAGIEDLGLHLAERDGGESHLIGGCLAMDERIAQRVGQHFVRMGRGGFDEIAQHIVVLDLERRNAR